MFKTLPFILLLFLPELISARGAERPVYILRPVLPERMEGLKISLEIRTLPINDMGTHKKICILSTNMVNRNHSPVRIKISYYYQDEQKEKLIEIAGNQQKIILLDKQFLNPDGNSTIKMLYSQIELDYSNKISPFSPALTSTDTRVK